MLEQVTDTARELLRFKAETDTIAYAKEIAQYFDVYDPNVIKDFGFWASVLHFEIRYQSINYFLELDQPKNVLELSSGFSLRGLSYKENQSNFNYWDTDLKTVIESKRQLLEIWKKETVANLFYCPLDVLDPSSFPALNEEVLIVNEGLLMYFDWEGKKKIVQNIYNFLEQNGGAWVTADIYIEHQTNVIGSDRDQKWDTFFKKEKVKNHYFSSFEEAEAFFYEMGFRIVEKYEPQFEKMSSLPKLLQSASEQQLAKMRAKGKIQETWKLVLR